ncbi:DUF2252 domain-containing protein [Nakamurella sp. GG22]
MTDVLAPLSADDDEQRSSLIVDSLTEAFEPLMHADAAAFRAKFRKMAADPFAFFRGSACVFYADVARLDDHWVDERGSRTWIQGDLHAENFGTYLDSDGRLVFDVNDFDEAYLGHWTWDPQRFAASLALLGWRKALPDEVIARLIEQYARAYLDQVNHFVGTPDDTRWALTLETSTGAVLGALQAAKLQTRVGLLDSVTVVDGYRRTFAQRAGVRRLDDDERDVVLEAFAGYLETIPGGRRDGVTFDVLDVVGKSGFGIGSAGLPAYNVLIEGFSQALDNDVVLTLKQGNIAAPSRVVDDADIRGRFEHHGHRTALSQRALQAHADRFLGWADVPLNGHSTGFVVSEYSPYEADLAWDDITEPAEIGPLVEQLGRATAKIHCVSDDEAEDGLVDFSVEQVIAQAVDGRVDEYAADLAQFAQAYARRAQEDHRLFVEAFRAGGFALVAPTGEATPGKPYSEGGSGIVGEN